jgi:hypothetical protein
LRQIVEELFREVYDQGLDILSAQSDKPIGDLVLLHREEICAAVNRLRALRIAVFDQRDAQGLTGSSKDGNTFS